jgi:hypothetical protein
MKKLMIFGVVGLLGLGLFAGGCATYQGATGALVGGAVGGAVGALADPINPWRGAVIGGGVGAILGGAAGESAAQGYYGGYNYYPGGRYYAPYGHRPPRGYGYYPPPYRYR